MKAAPSASPPRDAGAAKEFSQEQTELPARSSNSVSSCSKGPGPDTYFSRVLPEPFRILGLQLLPLSLGRYRILKRFDSPFVADAPAGAHLDDLILAVLICAMRCDEFLEFIQAPTFTRDVRRWSGRICPHAWLGCLPFIGPRWRARHSFNYLEKIALFQQYLADAQRIPRFTRLADSTQTSSSHWSHSIEVALRSELKWSEEEINEAPLSKALADYFALAERDGSLTILSDADYEQAANNTLRIAEALARCTSVPSVPSVPEAAAEHNLPIAPNQQ